MVFDFDFKEKSLKNIAVYETLEQIMLLPIGSFQQGIQIC